MQSWILFGGGDGDGGDGVVVQIGHEREKYGAALGVRGGVIMMY